MNYRTASKQQLLAERARLMNGYRKAEQRLGTSTFTNATGGSAARRNRGSTRAPQHEAERLADQLAMVEAELKRRDEQEAPQATPASVEAAGEP